MDTISGTPNKATRNDGSLLDNSAKEIGDNTISQPEEAKKLKIEVLKDLWGTGDNTNSFETQTIPITSWQNEILVGENDIELPKNLDKAKIQEKKVLLREKKD